MRKNIRKNVTQTRKDGDKNEKGRKEMDESDLLFIMYDVDLWHIHYRSISSRNKKLTADKQP